MLPKTEQQEGIIKMITAELYEFYKRNGYKIIFSAGYSPQNKAIKSGEQSEEKIYKAAKVPISKWKEQKETKSKEEIERWLSQKGWVSAVLPSGYIALDVDSKNFEQRKYKTEGVKSLCAPHSFGIHQTQNGLHLIFKTPCEYTANQDTMTKAGFVLTYRPGVITNIIVAPTPNRSWVRLVENDKLSLLPELLRPLDAKSLPETRRALALQIGYGYRSGLIAGNDHIDLAFMHFLVNDCGNDWPVVEELFQEIYALEYDENKTRINFQRAGNKSQKCKTIDTLLQVLHEKKLLNIIQLINNYGVLSTDGKNAKFTELRDFSFETLTKKKISFKSICVQYARSYAEKNKISYINETFYRRNKDYIYQKLNNERDMRNVFASWMETVFDIYDSKAIDEMIKSIKDLKHTYYEPSNKECLMSNGKVLNFETLQIREPNDSDMFFYKTNGTYDLKAEAPRFFQFLAEIFPENTQDHFEFLQRYIGYLFYPKNKYELALIFRGEGSNGKSVFMDVIEKVIGENNVSHVSLSKLQNENHRTHLIGKLLNMNAEIESKIVVDDDVIKTLVSGETMSARHLYRDTFEFKPFCKFIYASNNAVTSLDKSHGYERRILFIDFKVNFDTMPHKKDVNLRPKLYFEMDGIFTWAIEGLRKVLKEDSLKVPESLRNTSKKEHLQNNPVFEFLSEHVVWSLQPDAKVFIQDLYLEYKKFCTMNGYKISNKANFLKNFKRLLTDSPLKQLEYRTSSKRGYQYMWLIPTYYDLRRGELLIPTDARVIAPNCEKPVTEINFEKFKEWRKTPEGV